MKDLIYLVSIVHGSFVDLYLKCWFLIIDIRHTINSMPQALRHNFMNIDESVGTPM